MAPPLQQFFEFWQDIQHPRVLWQVGVIGRQRISVLLMLQATLSVVTAVLIALWLGRYVEATLMAADSVQVSLRVMLTKLAKALFVLLAVLIALPAVGMDITALSVFGGMLGVGIGFGLQKIASNYVSGFIILMDRSVSLGDVVTIEQHTGRVTKMTARYVVLRNPAGIDTLIPNETLIGSVFRNPAALRRGRHRNSLPAEGSADASGGGARPGNAFRDKDLMRTTKIAGDCLFPPPELR